MRVLKTQKMGQLYWPVTRPDPVKIVNPMTYDPENAERHLHVGD